jgi:hypothetical protein
METADIRQLEAQLLEARKRSWSNALAEEARRHGCNRTPNAPRREDLAELRRMSKADALSIAKTYNAAVEREIERLYAVNVRGNRQYYFSNLERWARQRDSWKLQQISLNTDTTAHEYAKRRFREQNYSGKEKYRLIGAPPVCAICTRLYGMGFVSEETTIRNSMPAHINCGHSWQIVKPPRLDCRDIWLG